MPSQTPTGGKFVALSVDDLSLPGGGLVAITGPSGSGKSTLLYALAGLIEHAKGEVRFDGVDLLALPMPARARWRRRMLGFVFQQFHLIPEMSPLDNVLLPAGFASFRTPAALARRATMLLDRFEVPSRRRRASDMSRGEQQRIALARALLFDPPVIFADEPTASLDSDAGRKIAVLLSDTARDAGRLVLAVSHDQALIAESDLQIRLDHGRMLDGTPA